MKTTETVTDTIRHALLKERVKFIELMIMNGFVMRNFLTVQNLAQLYNEAVREIFGKKTFDLIVLIAAFSQAVHFKDLPDQLRRLTGFKGGVIHLRSIHKLLVVIMKAHRMPSYEMDLQAGAKARNKKRESDKDPFMDLQQRKFDVSRMDIRFLG